MEERGARSVGVALLGWGPQAGCCFPLPRPATALALNIGHESMRKTPCSHLQTAVIRAPTHFEQLPGRQGGAVGELRRRGGGGICTIHVDSFHT
eukprot:1002493-Rhodomonas_salina.1